MKLNNVVTVEYSLTYPRGIVEIITKQSNMHTTNIVRKSKNVVVYDYQVQILQNYAENNYTNNNKNILILLLLRNIIG